ncbi:hypothetical protein [Phormidium sp. FACHB-1136]|uniref:hypothetical protein n=1 Tax=Phormidium sp. FACHB-1136 TaxID=2692848 RepID=UPI00168561CE|nr:hypothetical protein [Phormidium sp. FACHB-1136]MBD2426797.1 hypothetical protein [Phormidium sp. FACHB-1136]
MKTLAFLGASALAAGSIALSGTFAPAQALTSTGVSCTAASGLFNPMYMECWGAFEGNDVSEGGSDNSSGLIALLTEYTTNKGLLGTWSASTADKSDNNPGNGVFTSNPTTNSGILTFDTAKVGLFGISLKASNSFSLYLFDGGTTGISSINFNTIGTSLTGGPNPQGQGLSHASFFAFTPDDSGDVDVPEPATAAALGTFAMLGLAMKKKTKVSA